MSGGSFDALFDEFRETAFRYEARHSYNVGGAEAERLTAYREHRPRPERSVRTSPWLARVARTTADGKRWSRLRVVDTPLTDYQEFQLFSGTYLESAAVGDETRILDRALTGAAAEEPDFWLFDGARAIVLDYTDEGAFAGWREVTDRATLQLYRDIAEHLFDRAESLAAFLAARERTVA
jgi:hypothetical protein